MSTSSDQNSGINNDKYDVMYRSFVDRSNLPRKVSETIGLIAQDASVLGLDSAKSCLAAGAGTGMCEIEFIRQVMPALQTLTAVEPDSSSVEKLAQNLQQNLLNVTEKTVVHKTLEEFVQDDKDVTNSKQYDVILLLHVFYYISDSDRAMIFQRMFDNLLRPGGLVVVQYRSGSHHPEYMFRMIDHLQPLRNIPTREMLEVELGKAGFQLDRKYEYQFSQDFSCVDDELTRFFSGLAFHTVTKSDLEKAIRQVWPSGKRDDCCAVYLVYRKP